MTRRWSFSDRLRLELESGEDLAREPWNDGFDNPGERGG
jgi:hypothetical protein